jgi:hypothetical protein
MPFVIPLYSHLIHLPLHMAGCPLSVIEIGVIFLVCTKNHSLKNYLNYRMPLN